jgi:hypothetical protein
MSTRLLGLARAGQYPWIVAGRVGPARLRRFFVGDRNGCQVTRELRRSVVFARHDLFADPPFSHIDLVCCRNVLKYLRPDVRSAVMRTLHHGLKDDGYLVLGTDESIDGRAGTLEPVSRRWSVYRRIQGSRASVTAGRGRTASGAAVPGGRSTSALAVAPTAQSIEYLQTLSPLSRVLPIAASAELHGEGDLAWILRLVEMGRLAAGLAHEVSQPLAAVATLLEDRQSSSADSA